MRTIHLEEESADRTLPWVLAGTALGILTGILVAERMSGRKLTARGLLSRGRRLAFQLVDRGQEIMAAAAQMREAWLGETAETTEDTENDEFDGLDELDEFDEEAAEDEEDDGGEEEDDDEDGDGADEDEDADEGEDAEASDDDGSALDERVLEAFLNDPVLAERAIEIESEDGTIDLHGRVRTAREVQHAVTIARGVPGVVQVRQRLRVRGHR